jgi:hypothetical protein
VGENKALLAPKREAADASSNGCDDILSFKITSDTENIDNQQKKLYYSNYQRRGKDGRVFYL